MVGGEGDLQVAAGIAQGFNAGIYRFNKSGGLEGRKIKFLGFLDTGLSPEANLSNVQKLVQQDHVTAVVPVLSNSAGGAMGTFLQTHRTPFVGYSTNAAFEEAPTWGFGINGNQGNPEVQGLTGMEQILRATGNTATPAKVKMAVIGLDVQSGNIVTKALAGVARYVGMKVVYEQAPLPLTGTTSYDPYAQAILSSGANVVYEVLAANDAVGLAAALKSAGYKGTVVNGVTYYPGQLGSQPNEASALDGVSVENEFPANENRSPAVQQAERDLRAVGQPPYLTSGVSVGYWSAIVFEQMLRATLKAVGGNPDKVNGQTLQQTVQRGFTYRDPLPGGIGTENFPAANSVPTGCGTLVRISGKHFTEVAPYQCLGLVNVATHKKVDPKTGRSM